MTAFALAVPASAGAGGGKQKQEGAPSASPGGSAGHGSAARQGRGRSESPGASRSRGKGARSRGHSRGNAPARPASNHGTRSHGTRRHGTSRKARPASRSKGKVTICHATGSATNPYVQITVSENALSAHRRHQHGEDLVGVPEGGCPGARTGVAAAPSVARMAVPGSAGPVRGRAAAGGVAGVSAGSDSGSGSGSGDGPAGSTGSGEPRPDSASAGGESLPFTGFAVIALALMGAGALAGGSRLRRSAGRSD